MVYGYSVPKSAHKPVFSITSAIMRKLAMNIAIAVLAISPLMRTSAQAQENRSPLSLTSDDGSIIHVFPSVGGANALAPLLSDTGPLNYNGGSVMVNPTIYAIFWDPPRLQSGGGTGMSTDYLPILKRMLKDYPSHSLDNNNTQYFQTIGGVTTYIHNTGTWGGAFVDTSAYPASACADALTPGNCLTNGQLQHEVKRVMTLKGWTAGINHLFLLFTSAGEGSCIDSSSTACAYTSYCAYHGVGTPIIYTNQPYGDLFHCQAPGVPSPNSDAVADAVASIAAHETTEAITDPIPPSGWVTALGNEIGDLCAYNYGALAWDSGNANEMWNGDFYVLQQMFDNHVGGCVQVGP
jgi:hypothetical protein